MTDVIVHGVAAGRRFTNMIGQRASSRISRASLNFNISAEVSAQCIC